MRLTLKFTPSSSTVKEPHGRRSNFGDVSKASSCMQEHLTKDERSRHLSFYRISLLAIKQGHFTAHYPRTGKQNNGKVINTALLSGNDCLFRLIKYQADIFVRVSMKLRAEFGFTGRRPEGCGSFKRKSFRTTPLWYTLRVQKPLVERIFSPGITPRSRPSSCPRSERFTSWSSSNFSVRKSLSRS